jgi:cell wall-associated NlpC family hydrolase
VGISVRLDDLRPGDLVFFDTYDLGRVSHVGIYTGDGKFAHASMSRGVVYDELSSRYFRRAFRGARRVLAYPR